MNKEEKRELYRPKPYKLFENGNYVDTLRSHKEAKRVMHQKLVEAYIDRLDLNYEIKPA